MPNALMHTLDASGDVQKSSVISRSDVARMQPAVIVQCFACLHLVVQIPHEHVPTAHTDLSTKYTTDTEHCPSMQ